MYLIGYDIGSSSVKAAIVEVENGRTAGVVKYPETEMAIHAPQPDWAEQNPDDWWDGISEAIRSSPERSGRTMSSKRSGRWAASASW